MRKCSAETHVAVPTRPTLARLVKIATVTLTVLVLTPVLIECFSLYYAKWSSILGKSADARTPILDAIHDTLLSAHEEFRLAAAPIFWRSLDDPGTVLPVAAVIIVMGLLVLRKSSLDSS